MNNRLPACFLAFLTILAIFALPPHTARGQEADSTLVQDPSPASDSTQILETLQLFFDGLAAKDSTAMLSVTDAGTRLVLTSSRADGTPLMRSIPIQEFVQLIVSREGTAMEETFWAPKIRVHDNLATVWVSYNFYIDEILDHCGEDTFQLFRSEAGWRIIAIADTQRRAGCVPEEDRS